MNTAILTTPTNWILPYIQDWDIPITTDPTDLIMDNRLYDTVFVLNYDQLLTPTQLTYANQYIVMHASDLPKGRGWSPYIWAILGGAQEITLSMVEAIAELDAGQILAQTTIHIPETDLLPEIRRKLAQAIKSLILTYYDAVNGLRPLSPKIQTGTATYYPHRAPWMNELDITQSLKSQINLLRVSDNDHYPAFFWYHGQKYLLKVYKDERQTNQ